MKLIDTYTLISGPMGNFAPGRHMFTDAFADALIASGYGTLVDLNAPVANTPAPEATGNEWRTGDIVPEAPVEETPEEIIDATEGEETTSLDFEPEQGIKAMFASMLKGNKKDE